jgi:hypothetical protein
MELINLLGEPPRIQKKVYSLTFVTPTEEKKRHSLVFSKDLNAEVTEDRRFLLFGLTRFVSILIIGNTNLPIKTSTGGTPLTMEGPILAKNGVYSNKNVVTSLSKIIVPKSNKTIEEANTLEIFAFKSEKWCNYLIENSFIQGEVAPYIYFLVMNENVTTLEGVEGAIEDTIALIADKSTEVACEIKRTDMFTKVIDDIINTEEDVSVVEISTDTVVSDSISTEEEVEQILPF